MVRGIILLLTVVLILVLFIQLFAFDFATSVIPGWHTTILAPEQIMWLPLYFWGAFVISCYIITAKKNKPIPRYSTVVYLLLSLPYPVLLLYLNFIGSQGYEFDLFIAPKLVIPALTLFLIAQLFFIYQLVKIFRKKQM